MMWLLIIKVNVDKGPYLSQRRAPKKWREKNIRNRINSRAMQIFSLFQTMLLIFSCWLLWTFGPNSPPRIPEHTTSKSNSMTTDYFLINLIMNYTNNKFTNIQRNVDMTHWDFEPNQSIKVPNWVEVGQGSNRYWRIQNYGSPVLDCRQCTENSLVVVNVKRHGDRNVKYREWLVGFLEGFCQFCPWLLFFFLCALPLLITIIISGHDKIFTICDFCLDIKLYSWCFWPQISFLPQLNWFLAVTGSSLGDLSKGICKKKTFLYIDASTSLWIPPPQMRVWIQVPKKRKHFSAPQVLL